MECGGQRFESSHPDHRCPLAQRKKLSESECPRFDPERGCQCSARPGRLWTGLQNRADGFDSRSRIQNAPVARAERHRSSKSAHAGSNPVWSSTLLGANSARTIAQDIVVIVVLLLRWATGGCALEDQLLFHGRVAQRMSADFLHRRMHVRIVSRSPTWRVNWAGAQRRPLSDRPARR